MHNFGYKNHFFFVFVKIYIYLPQILNTLNFVFMKKVLIFTAAASMMFLAASCNKEDFPERQMTLVEQARYLSDAGFEAVEQVKVPDFVKLAYFIMDAGQYSGLHQDPVSFNNVLNYYKQQFWVEKDNCYLISPEEINAQIVLSSFGSTGGAPLRAAFAITDAGGIKVLLPDGTGGKDPSEAATVLSYDASLRVKDSGKKILCWNAGVQNKSTSENQDIWAYAPASATLDVNIDGSTYARLDVPSTDWSSFPEDVKSIIRKLSTITPGSPKKDTITTLLPLLNFGVGADLYLNGTDSYRLHFNNISIKNELETKNRMPVELDFTLYGRNGSYSLLSGNVKADLAKLPTKSTATLKDTLNIITSAKLTVAQGKLRAEWVNKGVGVDGNVVNIYIGSSNPQIWFDPYEMVEKGTATCTIYTTDPDFAKTTVKDIKDYEKKNKQPIMSNLQALGLKFSEMRQEFALIFGKSK